MLQVLIDNFLLLIFMVVIAVATSSWMAARVMVMTRSHIKRVDQTIALHSKRTLKRDYPS